MHGFRRFLLASAIAFPASFGPAPAPASEPDARSDAVKALDALFSAFIPVAGKALDEFGVVVRWDKAFLRSGGPDPDSNPDEITLKGASVYFHFLGSTLETPTISIFGPELGDDGFRAESVNAYPVGVRERPGLELGSVVAKGIHAGRRKQPFFPPHILSVKSLQISYSRWTPPGADAPKARMESLLAATTVDADPETKVLYGQVKNLKIDPSILPVLFPGYGLRDIGLDKTRSQINFEFAYDVENAELRIDRFDIDVEGLARIQLSATFSDFDEETMRDWWALSALQQKKGDGIYVGEGRPILARLLDRTALSWLSVKVTDEGLRDLYTDRYRSLTGRTPAQMQDDAANALRTLFLRPGARTDQKAGVETIAKAVRRFLGASDSIEARCAPERPLTVLDLFVLRTQPADFRKLGCAVESPDPPKPIEASAVSPVPETPTP